MGSTYLRCDDHDWSSFIKRSSSTSSSTKGIASDVLVISPGKKQQNVSIVIKNDKKEDGEMLNDSTKNSHTPLTENGLGISASSDFYVKFPDMNNQQFKGCRSSQQQKTIILIQINNVIIHPDFLSMSLPLFSKHGCNNTKEKTISDSSSMTSLTMKQNCLFNQGRSTKPPTEVLQKLIHDDILVPDKNTIRYILVSLIDDGGVDNSGAGATSTKNTLTQEKDFTIHFLMKYQPIDVVSSFIYLWNVNDYVVVVDIDGTVTKSDVRGVISTILTENYDHVHSGVCDFFSKLVNCNMEEEEEKETRNFLECDGVDTNTNSNPVTPMLNEALQSNSEESTSRNIRIVYLSSRPIQFMHSTKKFISQLSQSSLNEAKDIDDSRNETTRFFNCFNPPVNKYVYDECYYDSCTKSEMKSVLQERNDDRKSLSSEKLPQGPIFLHPGNLSNVLVTELIKKSTHEYKSDTLIRQIILPFVAAGRKIDGNIGNTSNQLFLAGFGNKDTDAKAYLMAGMREKDIFIINKSSELVCIDYDYDNINDFVSCVSKNVKNVVRKKSFSGYDDPRLTKALLQRIKGDANV